MPRVAVEHLRRGDTVEFLNGTFQITGSEPRSESFRPAGEWWFLMLDGYYANQFPVTPIPPGNVLGIPGYDPGCYEAPLGTLVTVVTFAPRSREDVSNAY